MSAGRNDYDLEDAGSFRRFRDKLAELEKRAASLSRISRHEVTNVLGAAKNAMLLLEEGASEPQRSRFLEMAQRNLMQAERLVRDPLGDEAPRREAAERPSTASGGNERNDLARPGERDHLDPRGL